MVFRSVYSNIYNNMSSSKKILTSVRICKFLWRKLMLNIFRKFLRTRGISPMICRRYFWNDFYVKPIEIQRSGFFLKSFLDFWFVFSYNKINNCKALLHSKISYNAYYTKAIYLCTTMNSIFIKRFCIQIKIRLMMFQQ